MKGRLDTATHARIAGWAWDGAARVEVEVVADGLVLARLRADEFRQDLLAAGIGDGRHGFSLRLDGALSPFRRHAVAIRVAGTGAVLPGSPVVIEAAPPAPGPALRDALAELARQAEEVPEGVVQALRRGAAALIEARLARAPDPAMAEALAAMRSQGEGAPPAPPRPARPLALFLDLRWPDPGRDGGSVAALGHVASLLRLGFEVRFAAVDEMDAGPAATRHLEALGAVALRAPTFRTAEDAIARHAGLAALVYLHRIGTAGRYAGLARHHHPQARLLFSVADLHHWRLARQEALEGGTGASAAVSALRAAEVLAALSADAVVTHSHDEAEALRALLPGAEVHVAGWSLPVSEPALPWGARAGCGFIGSFGHAPNLDAAWWLVEEILPRIRRLDPSIPCRIAGHGMPTDLLQLRRPGLEVLGEVPDARAFLDGLRVTVAPLRFGAGVKQKVLASLACGIPCVATPVAAEGLDWPSALAQCVAADADGIAAAVVALHGDAEAHRAAAAAGHRLIRQGWSDAAVDRALHAAVRTVAPARGFGSA